MFRPLEKLSRRQREATPLAFAEYLISRVRRSHNCQVVAVLWVQTGTVYESIPGVDVWGVARDARTYKGPHPVVCHPPCGPWGKYRSRCKQDRQHGIVAVEMVERWGGVIEHPVGSSLFREHAGFMRGRLETVEQGHWGHPARKPTLLYWVDRPS